jgi:hypothetical protein
MQFFISSWLVGPLGYAYTYGLFNYCCPKVSKEWVAHQYEVWTCYFDRARSHLLFSRSDDCRFSCRDLKESPPNVFPIGKISWYGVCCIAQNPVEENMLLTGSYGEEKGPLHNPILFIKLSFALFKLCMSFRTRGRLGARA